MRCDLSKKLETQSHVKLLCLCSQGNGLMIGVARSLKNTFLKWQMSCSHLYFETRTRIHIVSF